MLSFFPPDVLDMILDVIESVSEGFLTYSSVFFFCCCFFWGDFRCGVFLFMVILAIYINSKIGKK